jgi:hypothetical protein
LRYLPAKRVCLRVWEEMGESLFGRRFGFVHTASLLPSDRMRDLLFSDV